MLIVLAVLIFMIGYVFFQAYASRVSVVENQRAACERGKLDRNDNARGWRRAEEARRAEGQDDVANAYANIATNLETRAKIDCTEEFPSARLLP
jgi:hypothetical protein